MISIVCPFYNEMACMRSAVEGLLHSLSRLREPFELILVNDGSTDDSLEIANGLASRHPEIRIVSYATNRGRGYALRQGIQVARGALIFTTEIDSSWGDDVLLRMYNVMQQRPEADMVVASPHLRGGGYRNVPFRRVALSRWGNRFIRGALSFGVTMNTGMTRGYRRASIMALPLFVDGKEFHLEVVQKAILLGWRIVEVPAILNWNGRENNGEQVVRRSSTKLDRTVRTHLWFCVFSSPIRYLWCLASICLLMSAACALYAVLRYVWSQPYAYGAIVCLSLLILAVVLFAFGVISEQNRILLRELSRLQSHTRCGVHGPSVEVLLEQPVSEGPRRRLISNRSPTQ
jgi:dolichol-phosphate mannosyltransferase